MPRLPQALRRFLKIEMEHYFAIGPGIWAHEVDNEEKLTHES